MLIIKDKSIEFEASDCITNVSTELLASKIMQLIYRLSSYQRRRVCPGELSWVECPGDVLMSFGTNQYSQCKSNANTCTHKTETCQVASLSLLRLVHQVDGLN